MRIEDYMKKLEQDPEYKKRIAEQDRIRELAIQEMRKIEEPFIEDLHFYGYKSILNPGDLSSVELDEKLIGLILNWIPRLSNKQNSQEKLVRALVRAKKPFDGSVLLRLFDDKESSDGLKWVIADAIAFTSVLNVEDWLTEKLLAPDQPKANEMLMYAAVRYFSPEIARIYLTRLFDDFPLQVADALTYIGTEDDLNFLKNQVGNFRKPINTRMNKAIRKLEKKLKK